MKYKTKVFFSPISASEAASKMEDYLNKHQILPENIVSINLSQCKILLVYIEHD